MGEKREPYDYLKEKERKFQAAYDQAAIMLGVEDPTSYYDNIGLTLNNLKLSLRGSISRQMAELIYNEASREDINKVLTQVGLKSIDETDYFDNSMEILAITVRLSMTDPFFVDFNLARMMANAGRILSKEVPVVSIDTGDMSISINTVSEKDAIFSNIRDEKVLFRKIGEF